MIYATTQLPILLNSYFESHFLTLSSFPKIPSCQTIIALLVDSWQTVALSSTPSPLPSPRAEPMKPSATVVCDALSFAVALGGISSLLVSSVVAGDEGDGDGEADYPGAYRKGDTRFGKSSMILVAMWFLGAVM